MQFEQISINSLSSMTAKKNKKKELSFPTDIQCELRVLRVLRELVIVSLSLCVKVEYILIKPIYIYIHVTLPGRMCFQLLWTTSRLLAMSFWIIVK